jgi:hypothetical protein
MADETKADAPDRFAHGTGDTEKMGAERDGFRPGVEGGASETLPDAGRASGRGADRAEGTEGAAGEMDFTGSPAGPGGGSSAGESRGGGTGGGAHTSGGAGPGVEGGGAQSIEATTAALGDMEPSAGSSEGRGAGASAESANDDDTGR